MVKITGVAAIGLSGAKEDGARERVNRGTWEIHEAVFFAKREEITLSKAEWKSERSIVARKQGNSCGAKGPH